MSSESHKLDGDLFRLRASLNTGLNMGHSELIIGPIFVSYTK